MASSLTNTPDPSKMKVGNQELVSNLEKRLQSLEGNHRSLFIGKVIVVLPLLVYLLLLLFSKKHRCKASLKWRARFAGKSFLPLAINMLGF